MSLDRVQVVRNFSDWFIVNAVTDGTARSIYSFLSSGQIDGLQNKRTGRVELWLAASQSVTVGSASAVGSSDCTLTAPAGQSFIVPIPVHKLDLVTLKNGGTVSVAIYLD